MRKYTRWGESGERPKGSGGEGPVLREKTVATFKNREWFWSLLPKLPFTYCFDSKWDWKTEKGIEQKYHRFLTVLPSHDSRRWKNERRVKEPALQACYQTQPQGRKTELQEVQQSITGSLAEASNRSFRSSAKGEGSNQWPSTVTRGSSLPATGCWSCLQHLLHQSSGDLVFATHWVSRRLR